ncbi:hypothetical protein [Flavobacterium soyae]|uniref:Uncharacterized protein n=1 Tax=Flavobacterium soyae TaxID=2903098 RepID=A0ABZ2UFC0_9FLAO
MIRVYYLFPVIVFFCIMVAIYMENQSEKEIEETQNSRIETLQTASSVWEENNN